MYLLNVNEVNLTIEKSKKYGFEMFDNNLIFMYEGILFKQHSILEIKDLVRNKEYFNKSLNLDFLKGDEEEIFLKKLVLECNEELNNKNGNTEFKINGEIIKGIKTYFYDDILFGAVYNILKSKNVI